MLGKYFGTLTVKLPTQSPNIIQGFNRLLIKYFSLNTYYTKLSNSALLLGQYKKATRKILPEFKILMVIRSSKYNLLILKVLSITNNYKNTKY